VVLREWLWHGSRLRGRLRLGVATGLFFGIWMGAWLYWTNSPRSAVGAAIAGVAGGAAFGTMIAVSRYAGGLFAIWELSELSPSDRVAVMRAVRRGEPVSDPRLAPGALACATSVMESLQRQQAPLWRSVPFIIAGLALVLAVTMTSTGPVWQAVLFWAATVLFLGVGLALPWSQRRLREKAEAVAGDAAEQIVRLSAD